jgi:DNA-binding transcriptional MerR regulator
MRTSTQAQEPLLRIGEVAAQSGVSVQSVRYYERRGLLNAAGRRDSGYREFAPETVGLVRFVKQAQELGFTLEELEELIRLRRQVAMNDRGAANEVRHAVVAKLDAVDLKMRQLEGMRRSLSELLTLCDQACTPGAPASECPIFEAIDAGTSGANRASASPAGGHSARRPTAPLTRHPR